DEDEADVDEADGGHGSRPGQRGQPGTPWWWRRGAGGGWHVIRHAWSLGAEPSAGHRTVKRGAEPAQVRGGEEPSPRQLTPGTRGRVCASVHRPPEIEAAAVLTLVGVDLHRDLPFQSDLKYTHMKLIVNGSDDAPRPGGDSLRSER